MTALPPLPVMRVDALPSEEADDQELAPLSGLQLNCLADALDAAAEFVRQFVYLPPATADVLALFVAASYVSTAKDTAPYLHVVSPEKRCGKTTLLECLELTVFSPQEASTITSAALVRLLHEKPRTLLLDEIDRAFQRDREYQATMTGVLNAGFRAGKYYIACEREGDGVHRYLVFGPKVLAGIRELPSTIEDRCLPIRLERKPPEAAVRRFKRRSADAEAAPIRDWFAQWAANALPTLQGATPALPGPLNDRQQDASETMLAIADLAGGEWPERARSALVFVCGSYEAEPALGPRLLADIRAVFEADNVDRIGSAELTAKLREHDPAAWTDNREGKPFSERDMATQLRPYQIKPRTIRIGAQTIRGYSKDQFATAWRAYAPDVADGPQQANGADAPSH